MQKMDRQAVSRHANREKSSRHPRTDHRRSHSGASSLSRCLMAPLWERLLRGGLPVLTVAALVLSGCTAPSASDEAAKQPPVVSVESGVLPMNAGGQEEPIAATTTPGEEERTAGSSMDLAGLEVFEVGTEVQARGQVRLYAAAEPETITLAEYEAGDRFTIMGPPGDLLVYPVELSGVRWYRVRAFDGLVGWVMADGIEPVADTE